MNEPNRIRGYTPSEAAYALGELFRVAAFWKTDLLEQAVEKHIQEEFAEMLKGKELAYVGTMLQLICLQHGIELDDEAILNAKEFATFSAGGLTDFLRESFRRSWRKLYCEHVRLHATEVDLQDGSPIAPKQDRLYVNWSNPMPVSECAKKLGYKKDVRGLEKRMKARGIKFRRIGRQEIQFDEDALKKT